MEIGDCARHLRQVEFRFPAFDGRPVVTATIYSPDSNGTIFAIWSVVVNDLGDQTQVAISAQNVQIGDPSDFTYYCDVIVIGKAPITGQTA